MSERSVIAGWLVKTTRSASLDGVPNLRPIALRALAIFAVVAPVRSANPPPSSGEEMAALVERLAKLPETERRAAATEMTIRLKASGPAGLAAIGEYFSRAEDVKIGSGLVLEDGKVKEAPSLRIALIGVLAESKEPKAVEAAVEALRATPYLLEATLLASVLERVQPGLHREVILKSLRELLVEVSGQQFAEIVGALDVIAYFRAAELLPACEASIAGIPQLSDPFVDTVATFPSEVATPILVRVLAKTEVINHPRGVGDRSYLFGHNADVRQAAVRFFQTLKPQFRDEFLFKMRFFIGYLPPPEARMPSPPWAVKWEDAGTIARLGREDAAGRFLLLDQLLPYCDTPALQQRLGETRAAIAEELKKVEARAANVAIAAAENAKRRQPDDAEISPDEPAPVEMREPTGTSIDELAKRLISAPEEERQAVAAEGALRLKDAGADGQREIRTYLASGQDVELTWFLLMRDGRIDQSPSLRISLLGVVMESRQPDAVGIALETLIATTSLREATFIAEWLERTQPGRHRDAILAKLRKLLAKPTSFAGNLDLARHALDLMVHFRAKELLPAFEKAAQINPQFTGNVLAALCDMPAPAARPAMVRLLRLPGSLERPGYVLHAIRALPLDTREIRSAVVHWFTAMDAKYRESALEALRESFCAPGTDGGRRARLTLLDEFAPCCDTAVLQQKLADIRASIGGKSPGAASMTRTLKAGTR